jgi:hypothetical protein
MLQSIRNSLSSPKKVSLVRSLAWKVLLMALAFSFPVSFALDLPPGVLSYLRAKDPGVKVRFDGLVLFGNGETYVPVLPQEGLENPEKTAPSGEKLQSDPAGQPGSLAPDKTSVETGVKTDPEKALFPDFIQFKNNLYLVRLIQTSSGRLTFPKREVYPITLKQGLLPQDFVLPSNLFIPVELKVLLGALPYNPVYEVDPGKVLFPAAIALGSEAQPRINNLPTRTVIQTGYSFDLNKQQLVGFDVQSGAIKHTLDLDCSPGSLQLSSNGKYLFVPCLSSDELVVVETESHLVKTRVPTGKRPDQTLLVSGLSQTESVEQLLIGNRYSPLITLVDGESLTSSRQITVPSSVGIMALVPPTQASSLPQVLAADPFSDDLFLINLQTGLVEKTMHGSENTSALSVLVTPTGKLEIWVMSRTQHTVKVLDFQTGEALASIVVGEKPVSMNYYGGKMFVLCAGDASIDIIEATGKHLEKPISLEPETFPASMSVVDNRAYIMLAASEQMVVVDLHTEKLLDSVPIGFRSSMLALKTMPLTNPGNTSVKSLNGQNVKALQSPDTK